MTKFDKPGARDRDSPDMGREAGERAPADAGIDDAEIEAAYVGCCCGGSRRTPSLIPSAVEEVLRRSSPLLYFRRDVVEGMQVADATMEPGDIVALWYVSANRDESRFDDPDRFDVGRTPNDHVAFGGGSHLCLGASPARLEIRVLLEMLVERYDSIELAGPVERLRSHFLHGIKHLPVGLR